MASDDIAELALELGRAMTEMKSLLRQQIQVKIREESLDISFELIDILSLLWRKDGVNQQELADVAIKDKSSITYIIDNLVKRNLVTRLEDESDRRNKLIFVTKEGRALQRTLHPWVIDLYRKASRDASINSISKAILLVKKMNDNLKQ